MWFKTRRGMLLFLLMVEMMVVLAINVFSPSRPFFLFKFSFFSISFYFLFLSFFSFLPLLFLLLSHMLFNPFLLTSTGYRQKRVVMVASGIEDDSEASDRCFFPSFFLLSSPLFFLSTTF